MVFVIKSLIVLFLLAWCGVGVWIVVKAEWVFGQHRNDPHESPGARALSVAQVSAIWFGVFAMAVYFLFV
jgi:hypothetical protein